MQTIFKYPPDNYGFTTDIRDPAVRQERDAYCKRIGEPTHFPLSDIQRIEFEIELSRKYRKEFKEYLNGIGGLEAGFNTIIASGRMSFLLNYYMERRRQSERKAAFSVRHGKIRPNDVARER